MLGGIFKDLRVSSRIFGASAFYLPPPNGIYNSIIWAFKSVFIAMQENLLFSSITPLINYSKFPFKFKRQRIGLWFTHKDGEFNTQELEALNHVNTIFLHTSEFSKLFMGITEANLVTVIGALHPERFINEYSCGNKIVWVGTSNERKNPELLFEIADVLRGNNFIMYGRGFEHSPYWERILKLPNLQYIELNEPLSSEHLKECKFYLLTSYIEGGPMPLLETLAAGLIPICPDVGFVREVYKFLELPFELHNYDSATVIKLLDCYSEFELDFKLLQKKTLMLNFDRLGQIINKSYEKIEGQDSEKISPQG